MTDNPDETLPVEHLDICSAQVGPAEDCPVCGETPVEQCDRDGPAPLPSPPTLHCSGCRHLRTKDWKDYLENDETDSGTSARCGAIPDEHGGKSISAYWSKRDVTPDWCPFIADGRLPNRRAAQSPPPVVSEGVVKIVERLNRDRANMLNAAMQIRPHPAAANRPVVAAYVASFVDREVHLAALSMIEAADLIERLSSPSRGCDLDTVEACAKVAESSGPPTEDEIDEAITAWYVSDDDGSLHDFLGWTWAEYAAWVSELEIPARPLSNKAAAAIRNLGKETRQGEPPPLPGHDRLGRGG